MHRQDPPQGQLLSKTQKGHFEEKVHVPTEIMQLFFLRAK